MEEVTIKIPSNPKFLRVVRAATGRLAELSGMNESDMNIVRQAVDEACSNVIKHAYKCDINNVIIVIFTIAEDTFKVVIEDEGCVKARPETFVQSPLGEMCTGGYGLHLIKRAFDVVDFDICKEKGNRLSLLRYIKR